MAGGLLSKWKEFQVCGGRDSVLTVSRGKACLSWYLSPTLQRDIHDPVPLSPPPGLTNTFGPPSFCFLLLPPHLRSSFDSDHSFRDWPPPNWTLSHLFLPNRLERPKLIDFMVQPGTKLCFLSPQICIYSKSQSPYSFWINIVKGKLDLSKQMDPVPFLPRLYGVSFHPS